ncbi:MAG: hypothetical protein WBE76_12595, partial [Terracidiphilus sp.]
MFWPPFFGPHRSLRALVSGGLAVALASGIGHAQANAGANLGESQLPSAPLPQAESGLRAAIDFAQQVSGQGEAIELESARLQSGAGPGPSDP